MVNLNRRHFLQGTAGALGAIGLSQLSLTHSATRYGQALAQDTSRKVALLVGINSYPGEALGGSLNDVELQRRLLIHRFGFNDSDIRILPEQQASRHNILGAFNEYLYEPAKSGDVVVFHFSGHGDRVRESELMGDFINRLDRSCINPNECLNTAIAPYRYDEDLENGVQEIMGHTLLLMRAALAQKTENVTFVLDCCYAGGGKRGNAVMRSLNQASVTRSGLRQIFDTEWEYQRQLLDQLGWDENQFVEAILSPQGQGFFIGAAQYNELAADYSFDGFTAGAFTYLLTQYLWQATGPLSETIPMVTSSSTRLAEHSQQPIYDPDPTAEPAVRTKPIYHIDPVAQPAEALVLGPVQTESAADKSEDDRLQLWLGGLDPWSLDAFDQGAIFSVIDHKTGEELGEVQQIDGTRDGLLTEGRFVSTTRGTRAADTSAQFLQEKIRGIPKNVTLKVALDETLTPAERQVVLDDLGRSPDFEVFPVQPGQSAHVLLGRYTDSIDQRLGLNSVDIQLRQIIGSIGLFSPTQKPILVGSFGQTGETIEAALDRLRSRFVSLYLGRMLALMVNQQTSRINVSLSVDHRGSRSGTTTRGGNPDDIIIPQQSERGIDQIVVGNEIAVKVQNNESYDLHFGVLVIDAAGEVNVLFPPAVDDPQIDLISSRQSETIGLKGAEPHGITELLVLASPQSLVTPLKKLRGSAPKVNRRLRRGAEADTVAAMDDIFGAMDTRRSGGTVSSIQGPRLLDVQNVAVLSLLFEIVPTES
ncbi:MAG: caspase family protein [Cyanobacteria bacterium P01_D01_bin.156]